MFLPPEVKRVSIDKSDVLQVMFGSPKMKFELPELVNSR